MTVLYNKQMSADCRTVGDGVPPLVSVMVVCYNQAPYVRQTLDSIRAQTYSNLQLIIADDCSTDASQQIIRQWISEHGIAAELVFNSENRGVCRTFNSALDLARGEYITLVASDDLWHPEKIARQVSMFRDLSLDVGVLYSDATRIDQDGHPIDGMFIETYRGLATPPDGDVLEALADNNFIPALTAMIRRTCFDRVGRYDERLAFEDWDMWLRLAAAFKFAYMPWPTGAYRVIASSLNHHSLLGAKSRRRLEDCFLILDGVAHRTAITRQLRDKLDSRLCKFAEQIYALGPSGSARYVWNAFKRRPNLRMAVMLGFCALHVPHSAFKSVDAMHAALLTQRPRVN